MNGSKGGGAELQTWVSRRSGSREVDTGYLDVCGGAETA